MNMTDTRTIDGIKFGPIQRHDGSGWPKCQPTDRIVHHDATGEYSYASECHWDEAFDYRAEVIPKRISSKFRISYNDKYLTITDGYDKYKCNIRFTHVISITLEDGVEVACAIERIAEGSSHD